MPAAPMSLPPPPAWGARRDWGRFIAFVFCIVFAVIGTIPLTVGFLVRTGPVRSWAARETAGILARELGVKARYDVSVQAWPMLIALDNLEVEASDGGSPFLAVERVAVRPRLFSLLAGKLDVGDVEIVGPRIRAVVKKGKLENLAYKLPAAKSSSSEPIKPPITSVSVTDARIDATIDDMRVETKEVDVDVTAEEGQVFEIALRAGVSHLTRTHPFPGREDLEDAVDEDVICRLDARVRVEGPNILVRRLNLLGSADFDPDAGTTPSCQLNERDWRAVELRLGAVHVRVPESGSESSRIEANGRIHAKVPASIVHRFIDIPHVTGSLTLDLDADFDSVEPFPHVTGHVVGDYPGFDGKIFSKHIELDLNTSSSGTITLEKVVAQWADGKVTIPEAKIEPFQKGVPLTTGPVTVEGIEFHGLLRDLGVHPQAHVAWTLERGRFDHFKGTLDPPFLEAPLSVSTRGFEIFNRPVIDPLRGHMMGVKEGTVHGVFVVNGMKRSPYKFPGIILSNFVVDTPKSHVRTTVSLGFNTVLDIQLAEDTKIDLSDISPLIDIPLSGMLSLKASGVGPFEHPKFTGDIAIKDFVFSGMPIGDIESAKIAFEPLVLDLMDARIKHGSSRIRSPLTRIAFDKGPDVLIDGDYDTRESPHLRVRDLLEVFRMDKDPRWADLDAIASGRAKVHYALGGKEDRCGGGFLDVRTNMDLSNVVALGERFDEGTVEADLLWDDQAAGADGMRLDLRSSTLRKGTGGILASATVRHGGVLQGNVVASGIPINKLDSIGAYNKYFDGTVSLVADLGGTLGELETAADVNVSRVRIGPASLPPSHLSVKIEPSGKPAKILGRTRCGNPIGPPFDLAEFERDISAGLIRANGSLFDGQIALHDVTITRQKHKTLEGKIGVNDLDLGTLANLVPGVAFAGAEPKGSLSATIDVKNMPFDAPRAAEVEVAVQKFEIERSGARVRLVDPSGPIALKNNELSVPDLRVQGRLASGLTATFVTGGKVHQAMTAPDLDLGLRVEPLDLSKINADIAGVDRTAGIVDADLHIAGPTAALRYTGAAHLRRGELKLKGLGIGLEDVNIDVDIGGGDARLKRAEAKIGGGTISMTGRVPLRGTEIGAATANITARGVKVPVTDGVNITADADLEATYNPSADTAGGQKNLPDVKGTVSLTSFKYTRPIALSLNLSQLGQKQKTAVDTYDPNDDVVRFNVNVVSPRPLRFTNNLVDMELAVVDPGLVLSGTNQRFGARGQLKILPDSKLLLRSSEFVVREGTVRFDDPTKIAPKVDVRAVTEYRRYSNQSEPTGASAEGGGTSGATATAGSGGLWRITLQARGDAENLKMNLSSDPALSQEDIVLLLTLGLTRAEIDRAAASSLGESVGLEALSTLTGADKAVKTIVPLIDEFRFGSSYSSKTGRTEPTVTIGKRITDSVRASVTTGITENREVRSNLEWRLNRRMSVQGSYDNINDVSNSIFGNIGADLRWRLEFE